MVRPISLMAVVVLQLFQISGIWSQVPANREEAIRHYFSELPVEKVYLHLDKDYYRAGESIWFKSYLIDGITHEPLAGNSNVYVELIDSRSRLVRKKILSSSEGIGMGDFPLSDSIADGNYLIRAYTDRMRNADDLYFFNRNIYISNPSYNQYIRFRELLLNRAFNRKVEKKVQHSSLIFYPEGGSLLLEVPSRLAFRAVNQLGQGVTVEGEIVNSKGDVVGQIKDLHDGMGYVWLIPDDIRGYTARVRLDGSGRVQKIPLPSPVSEGILMRTDYQGDTIRVSLDVRGDSLIRQMAGSSLIGHTRGEIVYFEPISFHGGQFERILPARHFPSGICQIALLSANNKLLAERLVFIDSPSHPVMNIHEIVSTHSGVRVDMQFVHESGYPAYGNYSVSVRGIRYQNDSLSSDTIYRDASDSSISQYLLLESDLISKGTLTRPDANKPYLSRKEIMDLLMLTNSWDRFSIGEVMSGSTPVVRFEPRYGMYLSGQLIHPANDQPVPHHGVALILKDGQPLEYRVTTDEEGRFEFSGIMFDGVRTIEVITSLLSAGYFPRANIQAGQDIPTPFVFDRHIQKQQLTRKAPSWRRIKHRRESPYAIPDYYQPTQNMYGNPSQTIYVSQSETEYRYIADVLTQRGTGILVSQGRILIRGVSSVNMNTEPMFMIDGMRVDRSVFLALRVNEVHKIEIFKGASTAIFGLGGVNGVIIAYTNRGGMLGRDGYEFLMAGFAVPEKFNAGSHVMVSDDANHQPTIFWQQEIIPDDKGESRFYFKPVKEFSHYLVDLEGIDGDGRMVAQRFVVHISGVREE